MVSTEYCFYFLAPPAPALALVAAELCAREAKLPAGVVPLPVRHALDWIRAAASEVIAVFPGMLLWCKACVDALLCGEGTVRESHVATRSTKN